MCIEQIPRAGWNIAQEPGEEEGPALLEGVTPLFAELPRTRRRTTRRRITPRRPAHVGNRPEIPTVVTIRRYRELVATMEQHPGLASVTPPHEPESVGEAAQRIPILEFMLRHRELLFTMGLLSQT
ncbi:hypothetical protein TWF281_001493 [Arthrobotrys megalospora]